MSQLYHESTRRVNTDARPPIDFDFAPISKTLRGTLTQIYGLTHKYGFCYSSYAYISDKTGKSVSTIRKHVAALIALRMVRREEVPGYADRLFVCPQIEWESAPIRVKNGQTPTYRKTVDLLHNKQRQPAPRTCPEKAADVPPVVVLDAAPCPGGVETSDEISTVSQLGRLSADPEPDIDCPGNHVLALTPEQTTTVAALVEADVPRSLAVQATRQDSLRAAETLRGLLLEKQRREVESPGAWFRVAFREGWKFGEGKRGTASHLAKDQGLRIAPTSPGLPLPAIPTGTSDVRGMIASLRAGALRGARSPC